MTKFVKHTGIVAPLDVANVDTDAIIPKQFLQKVTRTGFGKHAFHEWRFLDDEGKIPNPNFVLNHTRYQGATILVTRENFGCGSSREHAPWALADYGFKTIIGTSFADIFYNNSFNNQLLLITLSASDINELFTLIDENRGVEFIVNLENQTVTAVDKIYSFSIDPFKRHCLLNGLDNIGLTLQHIDAIKTYEQKIPSFLA